jgi:carbonic anhydrase
MPARPVQTIRVLQTLLFSLGLSCLGADAVAAGEAHAAEAKPSVGKEAVPARAENGDDAGRRHVQPTDRSSGKSVHDADPVAEAKPAATRGAKAAAQDPMDKLRELLADKLGATKAPQAGASAKVMRVAARSPEESHAAPAARHSARRAAAPNAAALAAAHREGGAEASGRIDAGAAHAPHWNYQGEHGPQSWGSMKAEFSTCSNGQRQSPIDIRDGIKVQLDAVQFDYKPSGFAVIDNGHTVQVNLATGSSIDVMGRRFELLQFHFHRPSEERINGRQFDMVAHLVHKSFDGRLAVVAVLLDRGSAHAIVQSVWNNLPLEKGEELRAQQLLDLNALLPAERGYFTYMGSLTTPPCSEGVLWMVMKNPVSVSAEQIAIFSRLYPMNARPIQSTSGRLIKESN